MTKLSYIWTSNDGKEIKEFDSWAKVCSQVAKRGGDYTAKYTPMTPDYMDTGYTVSEKKIKAMRKKDA